MHADRLCQESSYEATERLFGVRAVAGHSFLLSRPRDINAEATTGLKSSDVAEVLGDAHDGSPSPFTHEPANRNLLSESTTANQPVSLRKGGDGFENIPPGDHDSSTDALRMAGHGTRGRVEDLLDGGRILKRLKPLLDSFIQEDTHRTGTLPAADFRRILCEGHGSLWPSLGRPLRTQVATQQRYVASTTRADVGGTKKASAGKSIERIPCGCCACHLHSYWCKLFSLKCWPPSIECTWLAKRVGSWNRVTREVTSNRVLCSPLSSPVPCASTLTELWMIMHR